MDIQKALFDLRDADYALFQQKTVPGIAPERVIGVRLPQLRKLAALLRKDEAFSAFLDDLPHTYYDEDMLHAILISGIKDFDECLNRIERFLPFIDNWAVCDALRPKVFDSHRGELLECVRDWAASGRPFICRFGLEMLMMHFLDDGFEPELLEIPLSVRSEEYYVRMMIAWFFATALTKRWEDTLPVIEHNCLEKRTHNKTIRKACESFCIPDARKAYLKTLRRR